MNHPKPVFIADSCIGGLSVIKSLWGSMQAGDAVFMADYEVNPLGVKDENAITAVVNKWLDLAKIHSDTLIIACNTLSIRYHLLPSITIEASGLKQIISMVDCFEAMIKIEEDRLANRKILIIGTEFTASQSVYPDILGKALPGTQVSTVAATELERTIARFIPWNSEEGTVLTSDLRRAIENTDIAILACTCFPMAITELESQFPGVVFIDPGAYCSGLLQEDSSGAERKLAMNVSGDVVSRAQVCEFAESWLAYNGEF